MKNWSIALSASIIALMFATSCGAGNLPSIGMEAGRTMIQQAASDSSFTRLWGYYNVFLDTDINSFVAVPARTLMFTANVVNFLNNNPASLGFSNFQATPQPGSVDIKLDVTIGHPLNTEGFDGYDVRGVFIADGSVVSNWDDVRHGSLGLDQFLVNADGYTRWFNPTEFTTSGLFGYTDGVYALGSYSGNATINPYRYYASGLSTEGNLWDYLVAGTPETGTFFLGTSITRTYEINFPIPSPGIKFNYAVIANWKGKNPGDHPAHAPEPVACRLIVTPDVFYVSDNFKGGKLILDVAFFSWADDIATAVDQIVIDSSVLSAPYQYLLAGKIPIDQGNHWAEYHIEIIADNINGTTGNYVMAIIPHITETYANNFGVPNTATGPLTSYFKQGLLVSDTPYHPNLPGDVPITLEPVATGLTYPVNLASAHDGSDRLFVVEKAGQVRIIENGMVLQTPFLDIQADVESGGSEQGLLDVAFHPDYETNGYFFVDYTAKASGGGTVIERFTVSGDPNVANVASRKLILAFDQPFANHNGGKLQFGPQDGYLYIGTGDGGAGGDPQGNGQDLQTYLGKILRIDINGDPYSIPPNNPFANDPPAFGEIWAYGLRNPWQFSFDSETFDVYIADVGQNAWEEIDFQTATSTGGENYGWNIMEGNHCYPSDPCNPAGLVLPIAEYGHVNGNCSVTGLGVYRGVEFPQLDGIYFYADYCTGRIWGTGRDEFDNWVDAELLDTNLSITGAGEDESGNVYLTAVGPGEVYRIIMQ